MAAGLLARSRAQPLIAVTPEQTIITSQILRYFVMCHRRVWLDIRGDLLQHENPPSSDAIVQQAEERLQVSTIYSVKNGQLQKTDIDSWEHGVAVTQTLMNQEVDEVHHAHLAITAPLDLSDRLYTLLGTIDRLQYIQVQGQMVYSPILIKQQGSPEKADWLHLDYYVWLLQNSLGSTPPAELWLGTTSNDQPRQRIIHDYDEDRLLNALSLLAQILNPVSEPLVQLLPHCTACPWYASCQDNAHQAGALELLYGVSRKTRQNMRQVGFNTLTNVATASVEELRQIKGIGPITAPAIRANAQACLDSKPVWYNPLPIAADSDDVWMFDLETLEVNRQTLPWCLGWCDKHGETQIALVAPVRQTEQLILPDQQTVTLVPDYESVWAIFAQSISASAAPIYHWTGYDVAILRSTAPDDIRQRLEPRMFDLHRVFTRAVSLPLKSTSIKAISVYLGFQWIGTNDWFEAFQDYRAWIEAGDIQALTRASRYQRTDVQSMAWVWQWITRTRPE